MIVIVDFDGTLALGKSRILERLPNKSLIKRLQKLKTLINPTIKIVTARGSRFNLTESQKIERYYADMETWLTRNKVPYNFISFNKEYGSLYIDDMTIGQNEKFSSILSSFTKNNLIVTKKTVIKHTNKAELEIAWYELAKGIVNIPKVLFCNDEMIILERIVNYRKPTANEFIDLIESYKDKEIPNNAFQTYVDNIKIAPLSTYKVQNIVHNLPEHSGTFFHGDLSTTNVLVKKNKIFCIDSNYKDVFGSYLTDAGKAFFSLVAYEKDYSQANFICQKYGKDVVRFAVTEGLRVCKYDNRYISIVNNIAELI
jgi:thiamine kinase-like enzyme